MIQQISQLVAYSRYQLWVMPARMVSLSGHADVKIKRPSWLHGFNHWENCEFLDFGDTQKHEIGFKYDFLQLAGSIWVKEPVKKANNLEYLWRILWAGLSFFIKFVQYLLSKNSSSFFVSVSFAKRIFSNPRFFKSFRKTGPGSQKSQASEVYSSST